MIPRPRTSMDPSAAATTAPTPRVKRHHWVVRLTHWLTAILLVGMIGSGLQIYAAFPHFGPRGAPYPVPNPWAGESFPEWARLGGWLAGGLNWHFALAWPFILTGIVYLGAISVLSGFAIYKPIQLSWLTTLFGGYELARYWHFVTVWVFVGFTLLHVALVFLVDPASLRAMITGWYRGRFPSHD